MNCASKKRVHKFTYCGLESLNAYLVLEGNRQAMEGPYDFACVLQDGVEFGCSSEGTLNEDLGQAIHLRRQVNISSYT